MKWRRSVSVAASEDVWHRSLSESVNVRDSVSDTMRDEMEVLFFHVTDASWIYTHPSCAPNFARGWVAEQKRTTEVSLRETLRAGQDIALEAS